MARGTLMAWLLAGAACGAPAPVAAPPEPTPSSVASATPPPPAPAPRPSYHRDDFRDPDALPAGAVRRFGSRRLHGSHGLALLDNGWLVEGPRIWRKDGFVADWTQGRMLGRRGDELAFFDDRTLHWVKADGTAVVDVKPDCEGSFPWLSSDGRHALCRAKGPGEKDVTRVFDARTGEPKSELPVPVYGASPTTTVAGERWVSEETNEGKRELVAYDLGTGEQLWRRPANDTHTATLSPDAKVLYRVGPRGHLSAHAADTGARRWRFALPPWHFRGPLRVSLDGRHIAFEMRRPEGEAPPSVRVGVLDLNRRRVRVLAEGSPRQLDFSPRGTELAVEVDGELRVIDVETGDTLYEPLHPHRRLLGASVYGDLVVSVSREGWLQTWDRTTGEARLEKKLTHNPQGIHFLPPPRLGLLTGWPQRYRVYDVVEGDERCSYPADEVEAVLRWPGGEVALVEPGIRFAEGQFTSRVTAVGTDCKVISQHEVAGRIVEAELSPRHAVQLVVANGTLQVEPSHLWRVRWDGPRATPSEVSGSRQSVDDYREPLRPGHTPVADGEPYLRRSDGTRESVGTAVVFNPAAPVALVRDGAYRRDRTDTFVFTRATGQLRKRLTLPPDLDFDAFEIDDTGDWLTVVDDASVVIYPLKP